MDEDQTTKPTRKKSPATDTESPEKPLAAPAISRKKQDTRFRPGQSGNPAGRPKGSRNKFTACLVELLAADCKAHAREVLEKVRPKHPLQYVRLIASLVTKWRETRPA
jgi:Family of unknown function (DUF5681)